MVVTETIQLHEGIDMVNLKPAFSQITLFDSIEGHPGASLQAVVFLEESIVDVAVANIRRIEHHHRIPI